MSANPPRYDKTRGILELLANSALMSREALIQKMCDPSCRDLSKDCGYPLTFSAHDYLLQYQNNGLARRVVGAFADECWSVDPQLYEQEEPEDTPFETAWQELLDSDLAPWHYLHRADEVSGIGRFGVLLFGFDDGLAPNLPVPGIDPKTGKPNGKGGKRELLYQRVFDETQVKIRSWETDLRSPRYGRPVVYQLAFMSLTDQQVATGNDPPPSRWVDVHWTRVLHLADNTSEVFGTPRMQPVLKRLLDTDKILSGSAEMYYKGAFPGISFEALPEALVNADLLDDEAEKKFKQELAKYEAGLSRYIALIGMTAKPIAPTLVAPTEFLIQHISQIATALAMPYRVFVGSEAAHLASTQDITTWNKRVARRQRLYLNPMVVRPYVQRLIDVGVLPKPEKFVIAWTDLNGLSDKDKADVALKRSQALMAYVAGNVESVFPAREYLTLVLGLTQKEADAVFRGADKLTPETRQTPDPAAQKQAEMDMQQEMADKQMKQDAKIATQDRAAMKAQAKAKRKPTSPGAAAAA
jgi:hypothetical protein